MNSEPNRSQKKSQSEKFKQAAREIGADESEEAFDKALKRIATAPPMPKNGAKAVQHTSDCATHNAPALKPGRCDCGATRGQ